MFDWSKWEESVSYAASLMDELRAATTSDSRINRPSYGEGEQTAHDLFARHGRALGLDTSVDPAGNLHLTLAGADRKAKRWVTGSHLDAVPDGGNFDGAVGVVAGMTVVHALRRANIVPPADFTIIAFRAEEGSSWFRGEHKSHFGSRALLGQLSREEMNAAVSVANGKTLSQSIRDAGFDPDAIDKGSSHLDMESVRGFLEIHIEQGPILVYRGVPIGIVSGIRGTLRARDCRSIGAYAHSGAVPREYRRDALFAAVELAGRLESKWHEWLAEGRDVVCTMGRFCTDPSRHSLTKVPGEVQFTIDIRSQEDSLLRQARDYLLDTVTSIGRERGVELDLGALDMVAPSLMCPALQERLTAHAVALAIPAIPIASGAGHDTSSFVTAGIPSAMIFVRNEHGSHNPHEHMEIKDFSQAARILTSFILDQKQE